jgi:hypothetical protein
VAGQWKPRTGRIRTHGEAGCDLGKALAQRARHRAGDGGHGFGHRPPGPQARTDEACRQWQARREFGGDLLVGVGDQTRQEPWSQDGSHDSGQ